MTAFFVGGVGVDVEDVVFLMFELTRESRCLLLVADDCAITRCGLSDI